MIRTRHFRWSDFESIAPILHGAFSDLYGSYGLNDVDTLRRLYFRFRFGKIFARTKHALLDLSLRPLFKDTYDPAIFVAETSQDKVIGIAVANNIARTAWSLDQIAVLPGYQGVGVGTRLVREITSYVRAKGGKTIALYTDGKNDNLVKFYLNLRFMVSNEINMTLDLE